MSALLWACTVGGLIYGALRLADRLVGGRSRLQHLLVTLVLVATLPSPVLWVLSGFGAISPYTVAVCVLLAVGPLRWAAPHPAVVKPSGGRLAGVVVGIALGPWVWEALNGADLGWDDQTYHAVAPAYWLQDGSITLFESGYQAGFPLHPELVSLWLMLPSHGDGWTSLALLLWGSLAAGSVFALAAHWGASSVTAAMLALAVTLSAPVLDLSDTFTASDLAAAALGLAGLALALTWPRGEPAGAVLSGMALGAAIASKVLLVPWVAGVAVLWWLRSRDLRVVLGFSAAVALLAGPWFLRNLLETGNPLFPAEFGPFAGPFDGKAQADTTLAQFVVRDGGTARFWLELFWTRWNWPWAAGGASLLGACALVVAGATDRRRRAELWTVAAMGLLVVLFFVAAPFSGTRNHPAPNLHGFERYLIVVYALGLAALPLLKPYTWRWTVYGLALASSMVCLASLSTTQLIGCFLGAGAGWVLGARRSRRGLVVGVMALGVFSSWVQSRTDARVLGWTMTGKRSASELWSAVDALPGGTIAHFSRVPLENRFVYFLFGRRLQHRPVELGWDGLRVKPLHQRWMTESLNWWDRWEVSDPPRNPAFSRHLLASEVDYVVVSRGADCARPLPPHGALLKEVALRTHTSLCGEVWTVLHEEGRDDRLR